MGKTVVWAKSLLATGLGQTAKGPTIKAEESVSGNRASGWFWLGAAIGLVLILVTGLLTLQADRSRQVMAESKAVDLELMDSPIFFEQTTADESRRRGWLSIAEPTSNSPRIAFGPRHFFTQGELDELGVDQLLGTFTQYFDEAEYRTINVGRSAELLNGTLLSPNEVFSMNQTIKQRTAANGYTEGIVIVAGGLLAMSYGGGVSITTAATWGAAFFAGLEPVEQRAHSIWIDRYTPGLEATVSWGSLDLRFRNTTPRHVLITAKANDTSVTVSMWGTSEYDEITASFSEKQNLIDYPSLELSGPDCLEQKGQPGFRITVTRDFVKNKDVVKSEDFITDYQPSPAVTCV
jgi:hypothetical protein